MSILLGDNFSYSAQKPLDGRLKYDTLADMIAVGDATMYDGCLAYCVATDKTYQWKSTNELDPTLRKWREFTSGGNIQLEELPEASADELNNIYMYMGDDDSTEGLVHAHFYQCVSDGGSPATYSWHDMGYQKIYVGHKADWDLLTTAEKIVYDEAHFDDDEGSGTETDVYSTTETKTNKVWIDGKPIYRKCCVLSSSVSIPRSDEWKNLISKSAYGLANIDYITSATIIRNAHHGPCNGLSISRGNGDYIQAHSEYIAWELDANTVIVLEYTKTTD